MTTTLFTSGLVCVMAAIVGGALKAFGIETPIVKSGKRQALLGGLGVILLAASVLAGPRWEMSDLEMGIDRFGGDDYNKGAKVSSVDACVTACLADARCVAFSFNRTSSQC